MTERPTVKELLKQGYIPFTVTFTKTIEVTVMAKSRDEIEQASAREPSHRP